MSTAIIKKSILFNTVESLHDNVTNIMSMQAYVFMVNDYDRHH